MKRIVVLAVCFFALTVGVQPVSGQPLSGTVTNLFAIPFDELIQVPVTVASRLPETVFSSPGTVYVVTREEIQRFGWRDLSEILKATVPNLYSVYDGGRHPFGARGFDFDGPRILVMIDGRVLTGYVFANSVYLGDGFSALNIERLEILMGPNSMLYGSSALEAVVNVVTRSGGADGADATEVNIIRGNGNVQQNSVLARRVTADSEIGFHYADYVADQDWPEWARYYGGNDYIASRPPPTHTAFQQHKEDRMVNMYARYKGLYAGYNYWRIDAAPDAFEAPWTYSTGAYTRRDIWEFSVPYIGYTHDFFRGLKVNVEMEYRYFNRDKFISVDAFDQPAGKVDHERQITPVYKAHVDWTPGSGHNLSFGAENRRPKLERADRVQGADGGEYGFNQAKTIEDKATTLFVQDLVTIVPEKLTLTAGLSYNHFDSVTNDTWTPRASLVWMTDRESSLKFTYGEGVREDALARPCEDPERLRMTEINYSSTIRCLGAKAMNIAAVYHMKYDNMARSAFTRQPDTVSGSWTSVRIPSLEVYGIEDMFRLSWSRADAFLSVNMNDREEEPTRVGDMKAYVPSYIVKAGVSYRVMEHLLAAVSAVRFGSANSYMQTTSSASGAEYARSDLPPWTKVDVNLRLDRFNLGGMNSALSLRVGNVFDEDGLMHYAVEQARGLLIEPRTVRVELNLAF